MVRVLWPLAVTCVMLAACGGGAGYVSPYSIKSDTASGTIADSDSGSTSLTDSVGPAGDSQVSDASTQSSDTIAPDNGVDTAPNSDTIILDSSAEAMPPGDETTAPDDSVEMMPPGEDTTAPDDSADASAPGEDTTAPDDTLDQDGDATAPGDSAEVTPPGDITDTNGSDAATVLFDQPWPSGNWSAPVRIDERSGSLPTVHVVPDGRTFLHYSDEDPDNSSLRVLYQRTIPKDQDTLGDPTSVTSWGYLTAIRIVAGDSYELSVSRKANQKVLTSDSAGVSWSDGATITGTNSGLCVVDGPSYFARVGDTPLLVYNYMDNSGIFGCVNRTHLVRFADGAWQAPLSVGDQTPAGIHAVGNRVIIASSTAVHISVDGGFQFEKKTGSGGTNTKLGGDDMAVDDAGVLYLVQTYNWANLNHLALLTSDDGGESWNRLVLKASQYAIGAPRIAISGNRLVVVYLASLDGTILGQYFKQDVFALLSDDLGQTWTTPEQVNVSKEGRNVSRADVAIQGQRVRVVYDETGAGITYEFEEVLLTTFQ